MKDIIASLSEQLINIGNLGLGRCGLRVDFCSEFDQVGQVLHGEQLAINQWQCSGFTNLLKVFGVEGIEFLFVDTVKPLEIFSPSSVLNLISQSSIRSHRSRVALVSQPCPAGD